VLDTDLIEQLIALLPEQQASALLALARAEDVTAEQWETAMRETLESLDWQAQRQQIGALISRIMPLETLVPDVYRAWRPIVRDAVAYVGTHLSLQRLVPKLVEQMLLPAELPLAQRLIRLIAQMPSLQKLGQMIARNRNLDPAFRAELTRLENTIQDIEPTEVRHEIERQLGHQLTTYEVVVQEVNLAEASVSAAVRFTWINPATGQREPGVFKVLKPYVRAYFSEELDLLQGLAAFFDARRQQYGFAQARLREMFDDVCRLLAQETQFLQEQANLMAAAQRYANVTGVRIPRLIPELSTSSITATTEESGVKVAEAFPRVAFKRRQVAACLIEVLLAVPLFTPEAEAILHADPHAGNLFVDEQTGDVIILDWALTERLSRDERRQIVLLMLAVALRDESLIFHALVALSADDLRRDQTQGAMVRERVAHFIRHVSICTVPGPKHVLALLDSLVYAGLRFSSSLLVARKVLFILDGVLHDIAPEVQITPVLMWYVLTQGRLSVRQLQPWYAPANTFRVPLSFVDVIALYGSVLFLGSRLGWQIAARVRDQVWRGLQSGSQPVQGGLHDQET
jgi:ubiquinone biosynthesis protein